MGRSIDFDASLLTGEEDAFYQLYKALPIAINDFLETTKKEQNENENSALEEISSETEKSNRSILNQITFENYKYYLGFENL